jgi:dipeptidyl-peptidase-4
VAFVRDGDLYVIPVAGGAERRLTRTASEAIENGLPEFIAQEEMRRYRGYWWAPDSRSIAYQETDTTGVARWHILDPMHPEATPAAHPYPQTGTANARVRLGVVPVTGGATRWIDWDGEAFPYLANVVWTEGAPLTVLIQNRLQSEEQLLSVDARTLAVRPLHVERDPAWINLDQTVPRWIRNGEAFLWSTERDGSYQLELRNRDGSLRNAVTPPGFGYESLLGVDEARNVAWVCASAEPTEMHVWRVPLDPSAGAPERMSDEAGLHDAAVRGELWVHTAETLAGELTMTVRRGSEQLGPLPSEAEEPPYMPRIELLTVGERELRAVVVRPRDFTPGRRYPVLVSVYGGPHHRTAVASPRRYLREQWYADQGFIVVSADGRGTPGRGREWERAIHRDVITLPLGDQVDALAALGARVPEMDLTRIGIYGWSFGGYFAAHAVIQRPDVFDAAVAGAPVADWRDYDTHYTERYMGLPSENAAGYDATSVLTHAARLERPLLVVHGTVDDNVYFVHGVKMSDAILRAGRGHYFLPLSGFTHMVAEPEVTLSLNRAIVGFLRENVE